MSVDYDDPFFDYRQYWQTREYENEADKLALKKFLALIPNKETIADIAAGFGRLTPVYAPLFKNCLLVDPSVKLLQEAKKLSRKYPNLTFKRTSVEKLPLKANRLDTILFIRIFHHLKNPQSVVEEFRRVLKPGGFLILEFANKIHLKSVFRAILRGNFGYLLSHLPENISTDKSLPFFNYHPSHIKSLLLANGFKIVKTLSVSNLRQPIIKKTVPLKWLLSLESRFSVLSSHFSLLTFLGPSIFVLAQKE